MAKKIHVNVKPAKEDIEEQELFIQAVKMAKKRMALKGLPIAKYDYRSKRAYLEYPDKSRKYVAVEYNKK